MQMNDHPCNGIPISESGIAYCNMHLKRFEIQQTIDREILVAMILAAQTECLGGEKVITVDLANATADTAKGCWLAESIANTIIEASLKISPTICINSDNFAIVSSGVGAAIATLTNGIYIPNGHLDTDTMMGPDSGVVGAGSLLGGHIKLYQDLYANASYALVGSKGPRQGEISDAGRFYRIIQFKNMNDVIAGIDPNGTPWESNDSFTDDNSEQGLAYHDAVSGLTFEDKNSLLDGDKA
jgi:hypothetical protein